MAHSFELTAVPRPALGTRASRRLRRLENLVPAVMYGGNAAPLFLAFNHNQLTRALENEAFYSHILTIIIEGKTQLTVLKGLQRHPYKPRILHLDLFRVTTNEKITMSVPLRFIGEKQAPGVKQSKGLVSHLLTSVEIRCLPADLPEYIEVDLSTLTLDATIHLSQLQVPTGIELSALIQGDDQPVVSIHAPRVAAEVAVASAEAPIITGQSPKAPTTDPSKKK